MPILRNLTLTAIALGVLFGPPAAAYGQAGKKQAIPAPEDVTLETKDGVSIRATWYAGTAKKEAAPIIMVHGWEGQRGEYDAFARALQGIGHATIVPDLRGHGQSTTQKLPNGNTRDLAASSLRLSDLKAMVLDLEACKKFLLTKHNAGECNIEMLCVVGAELGSLVAMHWAALDWSAPDLPAFKQGRDVKAVVLLSPVSSFRGLTLKDALAVPAVLSRLSVMIVAGKEDTKGTAEARRVFNNFQGHHPKPPADAEEQAKKQDLFFVQAETKLTGTKLLERGIRVGGDGAPSSVPSEIATKIIKWRLVDRKGEFPWTERRSPLGG
jgi:alpha-beta hydrolase superfamily lysophospholipase